jgi:hypothetical protein
MGAEREPVDGFRFPTGSGPPLSTALTLSKLTYDSPGDITALADQATGYDESSPRDRSMS